MKRQQLKITGMTCGGCVGKVTRALTEVAGVRDAEVSLPAGEATIDYDEQLTSPDALKSAVQRAGYGVGAAGTGGSAANSCCG